MTVIPHAVPVHLFEIQHIMVLLRGAMYCALQGLQFCHSPIRDICTPRARCLSDKCSCHLARGMATDIYAHSLGTMSVCTSLHIGPGHHIA